MFTLRPYQEQAKAAVYEHLRTREDNPCVVIPTAGGKTPVMASICKDAVGQWGGRVLILAHVKELLAQATDKLRAVCPEIEFGVYSAGLKRRDTRNPVIVAGIQSVYRRACELESFDLVIVDEAHLIPAKGEGMYRRFLADAKIVNPALRIAGFTATPFRLRTGPICTPEGILNHVCFEVGVRELIHDGFICSLRTKAGINKADFKRLHVRGGEFVADDVETLMDDARLVEAACAETIGHTGDRQAVLIFASSIKHGQHIVRVLAEQHDIDCGFVSGETPTKQRDAILGRFRRGELKYLCNVNVLTTGLDAPNIDCVALVRPTMSPGRYCQMVGRGFRLHDGKKDCLVLDFGGNVMRHGPVDDLRIRPVGDGDGDAPAKECPECLELIAAGYATCPQCGYGFPPPKREKHEAKATEAGILSGQMTGVEYEVRDTTFSVHTKRNAPSDAPRTMRVDYRLGLNHWRSEFICFEHDGYARQKAVGWWKQRSPDSVPATAERAVEIAQAGGVARTERIAVRSIAGEKYDRIVDYTLGPLPEAIPANDSAGYDPDEIPILSMIDVATAYLRAGLCVLPAILAEKRPALAGWKQFQRRLPTERQINSWFSDGQPLCVLAGAVSANLEMIDFDYEGELFDRWRELVTTESPTLIERLIVERSQSGGRHVIYRCETTVSANRKLAQRTIVVPNGTPIMASGKQHVPRAVGDRFEVTLTLIETRGEGGLFLCAPTPGYRLEQGCFEQPPVVSLDERNVLIEAACSLNEVIPAAERHRGGFISGGRPGDDFNERGDVREVLRRHGWELVRAGDNEYWRRPGKERGWSATLKDGLLYVFSSNAAPFQPERAYAPFTVFTLLDHAGDFAAAATVLRAEGYGQGDDTDVDLSRLVGIGAAHQASPPPPQYTDPGPLPTEMFRVPGFISEVMDHCLATAPYPNIPLAFCGALSLQAVLAARKVRDGADNRTNLYILALAYSAVGKDWPRKVNACVLHRVGMIETLGEKFASGEGIEDSLYQNPALLFQTDEIDALLQSINKARDARYENIMGTLLTMYSAANSIYPMRRKAGKELAGVIDQPCLVVFGTAIPTHYYDALSERMLTNGFFARTLIVESGPRNAGQEPGIIDPPDRVIATARWWAERLPGSGNLADSHPQARIIEADVDANRLLVEARQASETEYAAAEARSDPVGTTVWGRVPEQIRKLALLHAVSANHESPRIDIAAVRWANDFVVHQSRRMLFMAHNYVADNPFHGDCLKLLRKLQEAPGRQLAHSVLLKRMKTDAKTFRDLIATLEQQGDVEMVAETTAGRPQRLYRLPSETVGME